MPSIFATLVEFPIFVATKHPDGNDAQSAATVDVDQVEMDVNLILVMAILSGLFGFVLGAMISLLYCDSSFNRQKEQQKLPDTMW